MVLDGINILKESFIKLDDYKLDTAAEHFVGEKKLIQFGNKGQEIVDLYNNDQEKLIAYNRKDAKLVLQILDKSNASFLLPLTLMFSILPLE